jgi:hypothetical protein
MNRIEMNHIETIKAGLAQRVKELGPDLALPGYYSDDTPILEPTPVVKSPPELPDKVYHPASYTPDRLGEDDDTLFEYDYMLYPTDRERITTAPATPEVHPPKDRIYAATRMLAGVALGASLVTGAAYLNQEHRQAPDHTVYSIPSSNEKPIPADTQPSVNISPTNIAIYDKYVDR